MARPTVSTNPVVRDYYAEQVALLDALERATRRIPGGAARRLDLLAPLAYQYSLAAVSLARDYHMALRADQSVTGLYSPPVVEPARADTMLAYLRTGLEQVPGNDFQALSLAQNLVSEAGRAQVLRAAVRDPQAGRWARVTRGAACSFCLMIASRGAVYRSETTADFRAHTPRNGRGGVCKCTAEADFGNYEMPPHVRDAASLYADSVHDGMTTNERQNAFRRALYAERQTSR